MPGDRVFDDDDAKGLRDDLHKVAIGLAELRQEVRDAIAFGKWAGTALAGVLIVLGSSGFWWAGRIDADVRNMGVRYDERFKATDARLDKLESGIEARFKAVDTRFDRLEASIARLIEQTKPAVTTPPRPGP